MKKHLTLIIVALTCLNAATAIAQQNGPYSGISGVTDGAIDNPIARSELSVFESRVVDYSPAPGVGDRLVSPTTGFASLGDLYSPIARPDGLTGFDKRYQPDVGSEPSSFHAGSVTDPYAGNVFDNSDTYGFIGIDMPGTITLGFDKAIANGDGADFAVFENGFGLGGNTSLFAELAFVEVSSNGSDFLRFPSISLNTAPTAGAGTFQGFDMSNVYNLAGKHANNWGTPFDLDELSTDALVLSGVLDLNNINYVRLVDVVGSGELVDESGNSIAGISRDSQGNAILDNWVTFDSGGFDYVGLPTGAVGVINVSAVPEPSALAALGGLSFGMMLRRRRRNRA
ncbi:PEP-CTERM sorting domain-containing protein [Roseiconus lacunae]|uniref:PEP-CTERM sorting domain-containing protein n=1 Tax=Roseiconus lacunae TaxID=2605694 RepID=A0ABT7PR49_9BACT|nr:PEP-CTERM sorting domain-containing protein [Roseiconus lacunae]MDM4018982.1 PEP-CTERM sorting domain-containing protein [Roseiconus lacunae]